MTNFCLTLTLKSTYITNKIITNQHIICLLEKLVISTYNITVSQKQTIHNQHII